MKDMKDLKDLIEIARECGATIRAYDDFTRPTDGRIDFAPDQLQAYTARILEEAAKKCDSIKYDGHVPPEDGRASEYYDEATTDCASAIRAMKEK